MSAGSTRGVESTDMKGSDGVGFSSWVKRLAAAKTSALK